MNESEVLQAYKELGYKEGYEQGKTDEREKVLDQALAYCNKNNDDKEECGDCCLSTWKDGQFEGCYLEKLKEQK